MPTKCGSSFQPIVMRIYIRNIPVHWKRREHVMQRFFRVSEDGGEALQVVMLLAIAAVCLITIRQWWIPISGYFNALIELLLQT